MKRASIPISLLLLGSLLVGPTTVKHSGPAYHGAGAGSWTLRASDDFAGSGALSANWTALAGLTGMNRASGQLSWVSTGPNSISAYLYTGYSFTQKQRGDLTLRGTRGHDYVTIIGVGMDASGNGYGVECSDEYYLIRYDNGNPMSPPYISQTSGNFPATGDAISIRRPTTTSFEVYENGILILSGTEATYSHTGTPFIAESVVAGTLTVLADDAGFYDQ